MSKQGDQTPDAAHSSAEGKPLTLAWAAFVLAWLSLLSGILFLPIGLLFTLATIIVSAVARAEFLESPSKYRSNTGPLLSFTGAFSVVLGLLMLVWVAIAYTMITFLGFSGTGFYGLVELFGD